MYQVKISEQPRRSERPPQEHPLFKGTFNGNRPISGNWGPNGRAPPPLEAAVHIKNTRSIIWGGVPSSPPPGKPSPWETVHFALCTTGRDPSELSFLALAFPGFTCSCSLFLCCCFFVVGLARKPWTYPPPLKWKAPTKTPKPQHLHPQCSFLYDHCQRQVVLWRRGDRSPPLLVL